MKKNIQMNVNVESNVREIIVKAREYKTYNSWWIILNKGKKNFIFTF
jgi:hypothetical protein